MNYIFAYMFVDIIHTIKPTCENRHTATAFCGTLHNCWRSTNLLRLLSLLKKCHTW